MTKADVGKAIYCHKLYKEFYLIDDNMNWRIVFRNPKSVLESFEALTDINLLVPKGKFLGILGRNGAGKSTLLRVLGGVYSPSKGIVKTYGEVSGLFEMGGMGNIGLTGYAYADRYLSVYGLKKEQRKPLLENIRDFSELNEYFNKPLYTYSSGMRARLYFATATELQHEVYLVDELLSVGDEHFQAKCWKRLRERFTKGASGVLVTHDWSAVLRLCETAFILDKGRIQASGPTCDMVQQYLNLTQPTQKYARFEINPKSLHLVSEQDSEIEVDVLLYKEIPLALAYSIEILRIGFGWEIILLSDFVPIACRIGRNRVRIQIKNLPLVAGEYFLNLFLKTTDGCVDATELDTRSWTYGNGIKIAVEGKAARSVTKLPWNYELKGIAHAVA